MHYADGEEAKIGDRVVGKGYNVKGEIAGVVVGLVRDSATCNIRVAYLGAATSRTANTPYEKEIAQTTGGMLVEGSPNVILFASVPLKIDMEYGDVKSFTKQKPIE